MNRNEREWRMSLKTMKMYASVMMWTEGGVLEKIDQQEGQHGHEVHRAVEREEVADPRPERASAGVAGRSRDDAQHVFDQEDERCEVIDPEEQVAVGAHRFERTADDRRDGGHDEEHYRVVERFARQDALEPVVLVHVGRVCRYRSSGRSAPGRKMMSFVLPGLRGISRPRSSV